MSQIIGGVRIDGVAVPVVADTPDQLSIPKLLGGAMRCHVLFLQAGSSLPGSKEHIPGQVLDFAWTLFIKSNEKAFHSWMLGISLGILSGQKGVGIPAWSNASGGP